MSVRPGVALGLVGLPPTTASAASSPSLFLDINATGVGSNPRESPSRKVYFAATDPDHGREHGHQTDPPPARHW